MNATEEILTKKLDTIIEQLKEINTRLGLLNQQPLYKVEQTEPQQIFITKQPVTTKQLVFTCPKCKKEYELCLLNYEEYDRPDIAEVKAELAALHEKLTNCPKCFDEFMLTRVNIILKNREYKKCASI